MSKIFEIAGKAARYLSSNKYICNKILNNQQLIIRPISASATTRVSYGRPNLLKAGDFDYSVKNTRVAHDVRRLSLAQSVTEIEDDEELEKSLDGDDGDTQELSKYRISPETVKKLQGKGITQLFPIQSQAFDHIYDGKDVIGQARTGTGKTLAFVLPLCERFRSQMPSGARGRPPTILALAPTRELANQTHKEFEFYKNKQLATCCVYGGVSYEPQERAMRSGVDIIVGTPGRIYDLIDKGILDLSQIKHVILDEADRMMDMGFQEQVEEILQEPFRQENKPQMLLFSATMHRWVQKALRKYTNADIEFLDLVGNSDSRTLTAVEHKAIRCPYHQRAATIADVLTVYSGDHGRSIIFTQTKKEANELAISSVLKQDTQVLHGDINQIQREITLKSFRNGHFSCLVATDVAARGLDIPEVDLVIQCQPPQDVDSYIHRSGRTGRAGRTGTSIVFYTSSEEHQLRDVERSAGMTFTRIGAPQQRDVIKASGEDTLRSLDSVKEHILSVFRPFAEKLISERGAVDMLAASLALLSGNTDLKSRSLLSGEEGFTTLMITQSRDLRSATPIWRMLQENYPDRHVKSIRVMRVCKDGKAAVFDVPDSAKDHFMQNWKERDSASISIPTELPELQEQHNFSNNNRNRNTPYNGNQYGNRNVSSRFQNEFRNKKDYENPTGYRSKQSGYQNRDGYRYGSSKFQNEFRNKKDYENPTGYRSNQTGYQNRDSYRYDFDNDNRNKGRKSRNSPNRDWKSFTDSYYEKFD